jgi:hypothetical protein
MVPGSRGEIANALRLDVIIDDQFLNCLEVIGASQAKALLLLRTPDRDLERQAMERGIGVVHSLAEAMEVLLHLHELMPGRRGRLNRLADWFFRREAPSHILPLNPRSERPLPKTEDRTADQ